MLLPYFNRMLPDVPMDLGSNASRMDEISIPLPFWSDLTH